MFAAAACCMAASCTMASADVAKSFTANNSFSVMGAQFCPILLADAAPSTDPSIINSDANNAPDFTTPDYPGPSAPAPSRWPAAVVWTSIGLLVVAAIIGPMVRMKMPEELPPMHSHDEPPGASHHHGRSGLR
jgi:hypothetical protein